MFKIKSAKIRLFPVFITSIVLSIIVVTSLNYIRTYRARKFAQISANAIIKPIKVFQIGFSKCGTSTLAYFFNINGVPSVHHDKGRLPTSIYNNHASGQSLISPEYEKFYVFTDMEMLYRQPAVNVGVQFFKDLDQQYPGSKFILNTRNKEAWLKSRSKQPINPSNDSLLEISAKLQNISNQEMELKWSQEWDEHHKAVKEYFKDRPNDLLVFDIEHDKPEKLVNFFKENFVLDPKLYTAKNQTMFRSLNKLWYKLFLIHKVEKIFEEKLTFRE